MLVGPGWDNGARNAFVPSSQDIELIQRSAWKRYSPKLDFVLTVFSEVRGNLALPLCRIHYQSIAPCYNMNAKNNPPGQRNHMPDFDTQRPQEPNEPNRVRNQFVPTLRGSKKVRGNRKEQRWRTR